MLRSLQSKLSNKSLFFREIIFFVIGLHFLVIVLFCMFGFQGYNKARFSVRSQSQLGSTIVFLPLKKYVDPTMNANKKKSAAKKHQSRKVIDYQSYLAKQGYNVVSGKAPKANPVKKKVVKKTVLKKTKSKVKPTPKKKAKTVQKKTVAKKLPKKTIKKKVVKKVAEKPVKKKASEKKVQAQEIKQESVKEEVPTQKESIVEKKLLTKETKQSDVDLDDVTFVGYRELDKLQLQSKIQQAVELAWRPPAGMPQKTVCELLVTVGSKGKVAKAKVAKTSKIVAFDLSARSAIYKTVFPQEVWGKQITVELGI